MSQKGPSDRRSLHGLGNIRADLAACGASGGKGMSPMLVFRMVGPSGILTSLGLGSVRMFNSGASALHALLLVPLSMMAQHFSWCIDGEFGWRRLLQFNKWLFILSSLHTLQQVSPPSHIDPRALPFILLVAVAASW